MKHKRALIKPALSLAALLGYGALSFTPRLEAQSLPAPALMNFQGRLARPDGTPVADGDTLIRFSLWDAESGGTEKWNQSGNVAVANGVFDILLSVGTAGLFDGNLWMEIQIGTDAPLAPRQQLVSAAYAMKANTVPDGSIGAAQIATGSIGASQIAAGSIPAAKLAAGTLNPVAWLLAGNSGTLPGSGFLGTTDNQPLVFRANNVEQMRIGAGGQVGIGTASPLAKLHVSGGSLRLDSGQELFFADLGQIRSADNNHRILFRRSENKLELREYGDLIFSPGAISGNETAQVVMRNNGNVGIGVPNPTARLDVNGDVKAANFAGNGGGLNGLSAANVTTGTLPDGRLSANIARLDASQIFTGANTFRGNVSSGTTGPRYLLGNVIPGIGLQMFDSNNRLIASMGGDKITGGQIFVTGGQVGVNNGSGSPVSRLNADGSAYFLSNLGVGTASPTARLDVNGDVKAANFIGSGAGLTGLPPNPNAALLNANQTFTGANTFSQTVAVNGAATVGYLAVNAQIPGGSEGGEILLRGAGGANNPDWIIDNQLGQVRLSTGGVVKFRVDGSGNVTASGNITAPSATIPALNGNVSVNGEMTAKVVTITGGSDVAEPYHVANAGDIKPIAGMVVAIDSEQIGQMRVAARAYDKTVAGILSGANGISPGITLRHAGTVADGTLPVASIGRVWCYCDADANGSIEAGDMLTTSDTPGHAMKVGNFDRANGSVIGKAMSPLTSGRGLVLVLVSLK